MTEQPFFERLQARAIASDSLLCVGLDPHPELLPENSARAAHTFCEKLITATAEFACAFKPNAAFFEALGQDGVAALQAVIAAVPDGIPVILDAKRGDIASSAEAYARAAFDVLGAHALTVNPYLGGDAISPFFHAAEHGVFVLCKTSNPGADDFQLHAQHGRALYEKVATRAVEWNQKYNVGLVVGATYPEALARVRRAAPGLWFLVPGVGAQGGDLAAALNAGLRPDGLGMLISVSRSLARADDAGAAARELRDQINQERSSRSMQERASNEDHLIAELAADLLATGCVRFGRFTLKSGIVSPFYIDLRRLVGFPQTMQRVVAAYARVLADLEYDHLAGLPYAGLPIATAIGYELRRSMLYPRKEAKQYGTRVLVEGVFSAGDTAILIDDLATTGASKIEAIEKLSEAGLQVRDIVVLIDRNGSARIDLEGRGYRYHPVVELRTLLPHWQRSGAIFAEQIAAVETFLSRER